MDGAGPVGELLGLGGGVVVPVLEGDAGRQVRERIVRRGLVGDDVDLDATPQQFGQDVGAVAHDADRERLPPGLRVERTRDGIVEVGGDLVEVARLDPAPQPVPVDVHDEADAAVERDGQRLGAAHPAAPAGHRERAGEGPAEAPCRAATAANVS